ncbi:WD repeat-containing protein 23 [Sporothrix brasiliensis 5110]|uniref:WD repeat-containing protein 23 n=1 Tax=Sporothrix brasiliensis 5110 TaxID=1398154 RepID=A0A0C2IWZ7_9PEZI|nr:WD repeat-containing protein 23 [Sporothrix brasiliensis 5110]KIH91285.1 WD repeat-containing protein 23 [Sporothrix brasiliensis 5110]
MSAPQTPGNDNGNGNAGAGDSESNGAAPSDVLNLLRQAYRLRAGGAGGEYTAVHGEFGDDTSHRLLDDDDEEEDDDDDEYHDAEDGPMHYDIEIEEVVDEDEEIVGDGDEENDDEDDGEEEEEEDEDDEDEEEDDNDDIDEGRPVPYLTRRQLNIMLQGETLHNVLLSVTDWGGGFDIDAFTNSRRRRQQLRDPNRFPKVPSEEGRKLMDSGVFGSTERPRKVYPTIFDNMASDNHSLHTKIEARRRPVSLRLLDRELGLGQTQADRTLGKNMIAQSMVPSTDADMVLRYEAPVYLGQFSDDGNFFYSATKDFRVRMYDTSNVNEWKHYKTVVHPSGRWTMTDASLSPDNKWLAFTSMMPKVCLAPTDPNDEGEPYLLDLAGLPRDDTIGDFYDSFAIFSVRFSGDGRELVAGTNASTIIVYDIESRQVLHSFEGHKHDVNAVCFGDKQSPHLLYSGSDDATIKVWDRRSLGDSRAAGAFVGHCEGITYIDSKGDGRYILSNGKDQTMRLWDLRMAMSMSDFDAKDPAALTQYSLYDYRFQRYNDDLYFKHPHDNSVVTFRGHRVERTLIRCHFSPPGSSDGRYVYSASHSGKVYIYNLDATLAGVIDVREATRETLSAVAAEEERQAEAGGHNNTAETLNSRQRVRQRRYTHGPLCVRDASWHPTIPVLVASSFDAESMETGTCSVHSCDIAKDGDAGGREHRLYDDRMRPISSWQTSVRNTAWWAN